MLVKAFIVYVQPILEYNLVTNSSCLKKDIDLIEKISKTVYQSPSDSMV